VIIADTSGLLAYFNAAEPAHAGAAAVIDDDADGIVVSPFVIAELDYLVATRIGVAAELAVLEELGSGGYELAAVDHALLRASAAVVDRYRNQGIGMADASLVVLADQYATRTILTLDHRHFDVVRPLSGGRFKVVP